MNEPKRLSRERLSEIEKSSVKGSYNGDIRLELLMYIHQLETQLEKDPEGNWRGLLDSLIKKEKLYSLQNEFLTKERDQLQSQLTEARERLRVACELLESAKGWARTYAMQTYSKVASKEADEIEEFLAQIQEPNGKKGG